MPKAERSGTLSSCFSILSRRLSKGRWKLNAEQLKNTFTDSSVNDVPLLQKLVEAQKSSEYDWSTISEAIEKEIHAEPTDRTSVCLVERALEKLDASLRSKRVGVSRKRQKVERADTQTSPPKRRRIEPSATLQTLRPNTARVGSSALPGNADKENKYFKEQPFSSDSTPLSILDPDENKRESSKDATQPIEHSILLMNCGRESGEVVEKMDQISDATTISTAIRSSKLRASLFCARVTTTSVGARLVDTSISSSPNATSLQTTPGQLLSILRNLKPGEWLCSSTIDALLKDLILRGSVRTHDVGNAPKSGLHSSWNPTPPKDLSNVTTCIVPFCFRNNHWVLFAFNIGSGDILLYNSMRGKNRQNDFQTIAHKIGYAINQARGVKEDLCWTVREPDYVPQQDNGDDCGVFCIVFALRIVAGVSFEAPAINASIWRMILAAYFNPQIPPDDSLGAGSIHLTSTQTNYTDSKETETALHLALQGRDESRQGLESLKSVEELLVRLRAVAARDRALALEKCDAFDRAASSFNKWAKQGKTLDLATASPEALEEFESVYTHLQEYYNRQNVAQGSKATKQRQNAETVFSNIVRMQGAADRVKQDLEEHAQDFAKEVNRLYSHLLQQLSVHNEQVRVKETELLTLRAGKKVLEKNLSRWATRVRE
jgi:hypothetical protein